MRLPPSSTLFPYTTLFRSSHAEGEVGGVVRYREVHRSARHGAPRQQRGALLHGRRTSRGRYRVDAQQTIPAAQDRKSTRLNSSHGYISYAVFCLKKKTTGA